MSISVGNGLRKVEVDDVRLRKIVLQVGRALGLGEFDVAIEFVGPVRMRRLNLEYRGKDKSTDVLSFSQTRFSKPLKIVQIAKVKKGAGRKLGGKNTGPLVLGDIVISVADAARNAKAAGHDVAREVCLLVIHGMLHLCGHDHEVLREEKIMFRLQDQLLAKFEPMGSSKGLNWRGAVKIRA